MGTSNYYPNYYSLEDIIVTQEKVPCSIEAALPGMGNFNLLALHYKNVTYEAIFLYFIGILDPACTEDDLAVGKTIELPLWYAMQFDTSRTRHLK